MKEPSQEEEHAAGDDGEDKVEHAGVEDAGVGDG